ncbi:Flp pilus assembly protein CpaB [Isoptericola sp. 4D.3]|uniref:Flp pilus assembly protein CpaB n=1 Tax=Isoptericola peretonis TaxID=2918523 RepID=A0ABT0J5H9_9MICO|nr:Flp pilus assembly protein CpaB [Isoptericola sp. 4D.3]
MPLPDAPVRPSARRHSTISPRPHDPGGGRDRGGHGRRRAARRLRAVLWRGRFVLAAVCCGLAVAAVVQAVRPAPPPTVDVVVAVRALAAGEPVSVADLTTVPVAAGLAPEGTVAAVEDLVGRAPATALPAGLPLRAELLPGGGVVAQAPQGTVVVPVRLDDSAAGWLRPGDRVDLVVTGEAVGTTVGASDDDPDEAYLARRALVLPRPAADGEDARPGGLLGGAAGAPDGTDVTLVAVSPDEAPALSAASGGGTVGAVLVR